MTTKASTGLRNHLLATGSLREALNGGFLELYSGTEPATADAAVPVGTLLLRIYSDGTSAALNLAATAVDGFIEKSTSETWSGTVITDGKATWFRFVGPSDGAGASTTAPRLQGSVARAGGDLNISVVDLVSGAPQAINYFTVAIPSF